MNNADLIALIDRLRREPTETEWLEFKAKRYQSQEIGEYLSALSNSACLAGKPHGYLVFGIENETHAVVGTKFDPNSTKGKGNQDLPLWLAIGLQPKTGIETYIVDHPDGRVVLFQVCAASSQPVSFYGKAWIRVGSSKTLLSNHPAKQRAIWTRGTDWTAGICERATSEDLDAEAIDKAREQFKIKNPRLAAATADWDTTTFLNKAKLTIKGAVTNAAVMLLGKPESAALLSPAVAKISWILKSGENKELDYEHFGPPFMLQVDRILSRIRNLTVRALPSGTLFPHEISQYDPWVIREALHNCIAHQDYGIRGRINIVETPDSVLLTNVGSFLPGDVSRVISQDAPLEIYRNPFLAEAMVALNMIDTQGGGIKRMFQKQIARFFPLPDYDLSEPEHVAVAVRGTILDEQYCRLLMERTDLKLPLVLLLDKVQKQVRISREEHRLLKSKRLVEGRYPNLLISGTVARISGQKARHIREKGLDHKYYLDLLMALVSEHGPVSRAEVDRLLMDKLPEVLSQKQKKTKIHNMLSTLVSKGEIKNTGSRARPQWQVAE